MNLKKVTQKLSDVRDSIREKGEVTPDDKEALQELVQDALKEAKGDLSEMRTLEDMAGLKPAIEMPQMPIPHNDNKPLSREQRYRLSLMEKTGTGSRAIH